MKAEAATILIVDDEAKNRKLLELLLRIEGYTTCSASGGKEALQLVAETAPDLVLLDVMMPDMDGYAVVKALKADPATAHIPVILVTALSDRLARLAGLEAGAEEFVSKPVDRSELWLRVRNLLRLKSLGDQLQDQSAQLEEEVVRRTEELRESEARFSVFMEASPILAWVKDATGHYLYTNQAWEAVFTIDPADGAAVLKSGDTITEMMELVHARDAEVLATMQPNQVALWLPDALGQSRCWNCIRFPIQEASGRILVGGIAIDITDQKTAASEILDLNATLELRVDERTADLAHARDDATDASQAKSSFLAAMSHEIRTPMNGVIGMVDVLHQTSLNHYQVEMVDLIRESAFSLLTIIDDILDFSKIEAGRMELDNASISVADVVEKACGMLDHLANKNNVELTLFVDPSIPAAVLGDALRMRQVLLNIVSNAIKFSSGRKLPGRVAVRVVCTERNATHVVVEIRVKDNGIGMDEATKARLFSAFTQADTSTSRRFGGTGLGLVISRRLVELMGGGFLLQSAPDEGSTFTMDLQFALLQGGSEVTAPPSEVAGLDCLVVGGAEGLSANIAAYLVHGGAGVERATDLEHARALTAARAPGTCTWVIDTASAPHAIKDLAALAESLPAHTLSFVGIGRGARRTPRTRNAALVVVDGNLLTRRRLFSAVAMAAGRSVEEESQPAPGRHAAAYLAPPRDEAVRRNQLILVAEDNPINQKVILRQLALLGFAADTADNGVTALALWRSGDYALLLSDVNMPEMDGLALTAAIRAQEEGPNRFPVIAVTANALQAQVDKCLAAGMDDYLSKPLQLAVLKDMLLKWLPGMDSHAFAPDATAQGEALAAVLPPGLVSALASGLASSLGNGLAAPPASRPASGALLDVSRHAADGRAAEPPALAVDVKVLEELVGSDPEVVLEFLTEFQQSAAEISLKIEAACEHGLSDQAAAQSHKLRSSARTVGALALAALCARVEAAGEAGNAGELLVLWPLFVQELSSVNALLDALRGGRP
jgi:two-component system sensor histidine kinase/response regulator